MPPAVSRSAAAGPALLSIGQVLARLTPEFPSLTTSKLRFLEEQGIVTPTRTETRYRKFSAADVDRIRLALQLQRDHYLPLGVIREYLADLDAGRDPSHPGQQAPRTIHPQGRRYRRDEVIRVAGATPQLFREAVSSGVLPAAESFGDQSVALLRAIVALDTHGIEPRHLRTIRQSAERDVSLIEQALTPLTHRADAPSRARANEVGPELARRLDEVRAIFVRSALARLLP